MSNKLVEIRAAIAAYEQAHGELAKKLEAIATDEGSAQEVVAELGRKDLKEGFLELLSELGVKFNFGIYVGEYGNGRSLILQSDIDDARSWQVDDYENYGGVGGWFPSSASC